PAQTGHVVDAVGVLDDDAKSDLEWTLRTFKRDDRADVAILISNEIHGEPLAQYGLRVAEAWKLGRADRDDGLLIVVIPSTNAVRIEVGYGLEGDIPDAIASRWVDELREAISNHQLAPGLSRLLNSIDNVLPRMAEAQKTDSNTTPEWALPFVLAVFSIFAIFPLFFDRRGSLAS